MIPQSLERLRDSVVDVFSESNVGCLGEVGKSYLPFKVVELTGCQFTGLGRWTDNPSFLVWSGVNLRSAFFGEVSFWYRKQQFFWGLVVAASIRGDSLWKVFKFGPKLPAATPPVVAAFASSTNKYLLHPQSDEFPLFKTHVQVMWCYCIIQESQLPRRTANGRKLIKPKGQASDTFMFLF